MYTHTARLTSDRLEQPRRLLGRVWNTFFTDSRLTHSGAVSMYISFSIDTGTGIRYDELSTHHQNRPEIDYVRLWTISWPLKSSKWFFHPFLCQFTSLPGTSGENMTFYTLKDELYCRITCNWSLGHISMLDCCRAWAGAWLRKDSLTSRHSAILPRASFPAPIGRPLWWNAWRLTE